MARPRHQRWLAVAGVLVAVVVGVAAYASFHAGDPYATFRRSCLARAGDTVVTLSSKTHSQYMGGPATVYTMGCRGSTGVVTGHATTNHP